MNSIGTGTLGRAIVFNLEGTFIADSHVTIIRLYADEVYTDYLFYLAQSPLYQGYIYAALVSGSTNQVELSREGLRATPILLPPLPEQRAIAAFLARETARLDALAAKKERLIALLQEKRAALISQAVTRGLHPSAPLKESGVAWIRAVPAGWEIRPVWTLFKLGRGRVISNIEIQDNQGPYPVYSSQTENEGILGYISTYDFDGTYLTWTTDGANAGTVFYRQGQFNCTNVCGTMFPKEDAIEPDFFQYVLNQATSWYVRHDINPKLMNGVMASIRVQVPPPAEQQAIASYLDNETAKIDTLISTIRAGIEKVQEYRAAVIAAAVTGKMDVRGEMRG